LVTVCPGQPHHQAGTGDSRADADGVGEPGIGAVAVLADASAPVLVERGRLVEGSLVACRRRGLSRCSDRPLWRVYVELRHSRGGFDLGKGEVYRLRHDLLAAAARAAKGSESGTHREAVQTGNKGVCVVPNDELGGVRRKRRHRG
jgi:hypothetical protein